MVIVETIGRVRREHFVKGKTIKEIARDLKISRNTVRKIGALPPQGELLGEQSAANPSRKANSLLSGKKQGIFRFWAVFPRDGRENSMEFRRLRTNSLRSGTGK
jgi:hypothetical protein